MRSKGEREHIPLLKGDKRARKTTTELMVR